MKDHNINGPKKRPAGPAVFDDKGRQTVASMKYDKIDPAYLHRLLMEHKADVATYGKGYPVSNDLATAIQIVIKKTAGMPSWRRYTDTWKEELYGRAQYCALKYCHSYDPERLKEVSKNNDPYYYLGRIVTNAFRQAVKKLQERSQYIQFTSLNENILHNCLNIDEYAGVLQREKEAEDDAVMGNIANDVTNIDEVIKVMDKIDPDEETKKKRAEPGIDPDKV